MITVHIQKFVMRFGQFALNAKQIKKKKQCIKQKHKFFFSSLLEKKNTSGSSEAIITICVAFQSLLGVATSAKFGEMSFLKWQLLERLQVRFFLLTF